MDSKYLDKGVSIILFLILLTAPTQYAFNVRNAHLSIADPLIWVGGLLFVLSALVRILLEKESGKSLTQRAIATLKEILPLPENILFVILISLSVFKAANRLDTAKELFQILEYVIVAFVLFSKVKLKDGLLRIMGILFLLLTSTVILIALYQYFDKSCSIMDVKSTFGNRNTYGGFLAVSLPLVLALMLNIKKWGIKIWGGIILLCAAFTLLSGASALAILFAGSLVCVFVSPRALTVWLVSILILFLFIIPRLPRDNTEILKSSIRIFDDQAQVESRYTEWQASIQMWEEEPLLGVGLGNYQSEIGSNFGFLTVKEGPKEPDHNNLFLVIASTTGFIGLLGLFAMLLCWFKRATQDALTDRKTNRYRRILALGAMGAIAAFFIASIWTALLVRGVFLVLVIIVALSTNLRNTEKVK